MKKYRLVLITCFIFTKGHSQNNFIVTLDYGYGNTIWQASPIKSTFGDTTINLIVSGNSPTFIFQSNLLYNKNKIKFGVGNGLQHIYLRELFVQGIPELGLPTTVGPLANPTPNHYKFSINFEYSVFQNEKLKINSALKTGTFVDDYNSGDSTEGFHWFSNVNFNVNYKLTKNIELF